LLLFFTGSCCTERPKNGFKYVDATVDDLQGKKFEAILIGVVDDPDKTHMWAVIGDINKAQKIVGYEINADKVVDSSWIQRLTSDFIKAERVKINCMDVCQVIFLTKERGYVIKMSGDDKIVYGPDYQSKQISDDFKEMGLEENYGLVDISELVELRKNKPLSTEKPASGLKYINATIDDLRGKKFNAILIRIIDDPDNTHTIAVIGNIDEVQKILGYDITADKVVDSSWIQRLASDFVEAERVKMLCRDEAKMIFLTKEKAYVIKMAFDYDEEVIWGPDYKSRQIWNDFKEIGFIEHEEPSPIPEFKKLD
jgi:hypothetical protein